MKAKKGPKERVVCFCYNVSEPTIIEAIRQGCTSVQDIRRTTYASTGCAGCSEEVRKLLRKFAVPTGGGGSSGSDGSGGAGAGGPGGGAGGGHGGSNPGAQSAQRGER